MMNFRFVRIISAISLADLLGGCAATNPPPLPQYNPANAQIRSSSQLPQLLARDEITRAIESELSATAENARSAESMHHNMQNMQGMQHDGMQHGDMQMKQNGSYHPPAEMMQSNAQPAEKKSIEAEMKKTSDEMKATSDAMKKKSDELKGSTEIYTCPMHPAVQSNKPGKCPICGMQLVKKKADQ